MLGAVLGIGAVPWSWLGAVLLPLYPGVAGLPGAPVGLLPGVAVPEAAAALPEPIAPPEPPLCANAGADAAAKSATLTAAAVNRVRNIERYPLAIVEVARVTLGRWTSSTFQSRAGSQVHVPATLQGVPIQRPIRPTSRESAISDARPLRPPIGIMPNLFSERLSMLAARLSPSTKTWPAGTTVSSIVLK